MSNQMIVALKNDEVRNKFIKRFGSNGKISYHNLHQALFSCGISGISDWLIEDFYLYLDKEDESYISLAAVNEHLALYGFLLVTNSPLSAIRRKLAPT